MISMTVKEAAGAIWLHSPPSTTLMRERMEDTRRGSFWTRLSDSF